MIFSILFTASWVGLAWGLDNGVGKLPKMGYDTFNAFACNYSQTTILAQASAMVRHGLVAAGYNSMLLDDCYVLPNRSASGSLVADPAKYPHGMKNLTTSLGAMGISSSAYSSSGYLTCQGYPASYGHEMQDLTTFRDWGFDYLKYDNCHIPFDNVTMESEYGRFQRMADAIATLALKTNSTPFEYALCQWGWVQPWIWGRQMSQSWRIDGDIKPTWSALSKIIDQASFEYWASDFYGHNDMDLLEVGNVGSGIPIGNLTYEESKSHFTAWALLKSPLIISTDLANATAETIEILGNQDLIKINQDPNVGQAISPFRWGINPNFVSNASYPAQYWSGNSSYGVVFMILNTESTPATMFFNLTESWAIRDGRQYAVYDMWSHTHNGTAIRNMTLTLPERGVAALLLTDAGPEPSGLLPYCAVQHTDQCSFANGSRVDGGT